MTGERTAEVVLTGELDITTYADAEKQVTAAEQTTPALLIIDLAGLQFVDSTGVRLILAADQRAREQSRQLAIRLGDGLARRVFAALGLLDKFDVVDTQPSGPP